MAPAALKVPMWPVSFPPISRPATSPRLLISGAPLKAWSVTGLWNRTMLISSLTIHTFPANRRWVWGS